MENKDTKKSGPQTSKELAPSAPNINANANTQPAKKRTTNPKKSKKWGLIRHFKAATRKQQFLFVLKVVAGLIAAVVPAIYIAEYIQSERHFAAEYKPTIVNIRPPDIQFFACNPPNIPQSEIVTGNITTHIKNIGTAVAKKVNPYANQWKVIPEKKTGDPFFDDPPTITDDTCRHRTFTIPGTELSLDAGIESGAGIRQTAGTLSLPIKTGDIVNFYFISCTYYSDQFGGEHGTCDRYRFYMPAKPTPFGVDNLLGTPSIPCDGSYTVGHFQPDVLGHCEE